MALTKLNIYNLALGKLGSTLRVAALTENTNHRIQVEAAFEAVVPAVLRALPWKFAERRVALVEMDATTPIPQAMTAAGVPQGITRYDWLFRFLEPTDCLRVLEVCRQGDRRAKSGNLIPFEKGAVVGTTSELQVIYTDINPADLIYTSDVSARIGLWDPLFVQAVTYAIASELAMPMTGKPQVQQAMSNSYQRMFSAAAAANGNESRDPKAPECGYITGRF